ARLEGPDSNDCAGKSEGAAPPQVLGRCADADLASPDGAPRADELASGEITSRMLDNGEMYQWSESAWDAGLLLCHPCLGRGVSLALGLALVLNVFVQLGFCLIVWKYMLQEPWDDEFLDRLLAFRLSAHHVNNADIVGQRSLVRQVCESDPSLLTAAIHSSFIKNWGEFDDENGGIALMILAMFLWLTNIAWQLRDVYDQLDALFSMPRGPRTIVVLVGDAEGGTGSVSTRTDPAYLDSLSVTARLVEISELRVYCTFVGVALPRLIVAVLLGISGIRYLGMTDGMEDLILNAMALMFILDIDEEFFKAFLPRRVQTLVRNLEPLPLNEGRRARSMPNVFPLMVMIATLACVGASGFLIVMPFKMKLDQVRNILCSGQHDFVFSHNLASGVVHVAQSFHDAELTEVERLVLQVAQPTLLEGRGWNVDPELVALSRAKQAQVAFEPNVSSLSAADFNEDSFLKVANIGASTVEEAAHHFTCSDFGTGLNFEMSRDVLRQITGNSTLNTCSDLSDLWLCGKMASTQLRALCPQTCGCWEGDLSWAGAFSTTAFGCAGECLKHKSQTWERMVGSRFPCADTGPENFSSVTDYLPQGARCRTKCGERPLLISPPPFGISTSSTSKASRSTSRASLRFERACQAL
ncbi:unnamed protein product, partial [Prorocentrum cordatum]